MVIKVLGLLLLFSCAALLGDAQARALRRREQELGQLLEFLRQLTVHLRTTMAPPRELLRRLSHQSSLVDCPLVVELDRQLREHSSFRLAITQAVEQAGLKGSIAGDTLLALGDEIGEKPLEHQLSALAGAALALERELETARRNGDRYAPLYRRLGVLGGLLAVVLLV